MVEDASSRVIQVTQLAGLAIAKPALLGNCHLILIDGPAGSGKTTLAALLQSELNAEVVHMDDIYEGWNNSLTPHIVSKLMTEVLSPIKSGLTASYQKFNWYTNELDQLVEISPNVLIIEGVGAASTPIRNLANLVIWIEVESELGLKRVLERDGVGIESQMIKWQKMEQNWHEKDQTRTAADVILKGISPANSASGEYLSVMK